MLLMSFHSLPQRYAGGYQRECRTTAALLAQTLGLRDTEWRVTFQSRLGFARWLETYDRACKSKATSTSISRRRNRKWATRADCRRR